MTRTLSVTGMSCTGCEETVEAALEALDAVSDAGADHEAGTVEIVESGGGGVSDEVLANAIQEAGYELA